MRSSQVTLLGDDLGVTGPVSTLSLETAATPMLSASSHQGRHMESLPVALLRASPLPTLRESKELLGISLGVFWGLELFTSMCGIGLAGSLSSALSYPVSSEEGVTQPWPPGPLPLL